MFGSFCNTRRLYGLVSRPISLAGMDLPTSAHAAPPHQEVTNMRFYLNIHYPPTLCDGREYSLAVTPLVKLDGKRSDGQTFTGAAGADWKAFSFSVRCSHKHTFAPRRN